MQAQLQAGHQGSAWKALLEGQTGLCPFLRWTVSAHFLLLVVVHLNRREAWEKVMDFIKMEAGSDKVDSWSFSFKTDWSTDQVVLLHHGQADLPVFLNTMAKYGLLQDFMACSAGFCDTLGLFHVSPSSFWPITNGPQALYSTNGCTLGELAESFGVMTGQLHNALEDARSHPDLIDLLLRVLKELFIELARMEQQEPMDLIKVSRVKKKSPLPQFLKKSNHWSPI